jgi:outer membrane autotransporter protein
MRDFQQAYRSNYGPQSFDTSRAAHDTLQLASLESSWGGDEMVVRGKGCCGPSLGSWAIGLGLGGDFDTDDTSGDSSAGGLLFGAHKCMSEYSLVGVYGGYIYSDVDTEVTDAEVDNYQLGAYYRYDDGCNRLVAIGNLGFQEYDSTRYAVDGQIDGVGETDGGLYGCYLELSRAYNWNCNVVRPLIAVQYLHVDQNAFTETGGITPLTISDVETDSCRTILGGRLGRQYCGPHCWVWTPQVRAMWVHELADASTPVAATGASVITSVPVDLGRDWFMGGVGVTMQQSDAASITVDYDVQANGRMNFHMGSLGLNLYW